MFLWVFFSTACAKVYNYISVDNKKEPGVDFRQQVKKERKKGGKTLEGYTGGLVR